MPSSQIEREIFNCITQYCNNLSNAIAINKCWLLIYKHTFNYLLSLVKRHNVHGGYDTFVRNFLSKVYENKILCRWNFECSLKTFLYKVIIFDIKDEIRREKNEKIGEDIYTKDENGDETLEERSDLQNPSEYENSYPILNDGVDKTKIILKRVYNESWQTFINEYKMDSVLLNTVKRYENTDDKITRSLLAEELGIKENTLNQKICRANNRFLKIFIVTANDYNINISNMEGVRKFLKQISSEDEIDL